MPSRDFVQGSGRTPLRVYGPQPTYQTYKSPFGPKYVFSIVMVQEEARMNPNGGSPANKRLYRTKHTPNLMGLNARNAFNIGSIAAGFGVSAGLFAIFFFGEIPKVRNDILSKMPVIGDYFVREIPPEDNPF